MNVKGEEERLENGETIMLANGRRKSDIQLVSGTGVGLRFSLEEAQRQRIKGK